MTADTNTKNRIRELIDLLNAASKAYYAEDREIMSNFEYDKLYDELSALEEKTGMVMSDSPTQKVGYEAVDELPKERHERPQLSLGKTKSREELQDWLQGHEGVLSWKLDGLTVVLTYRDGELFKAVTRGNGEVGEVITANAKTFKNIPLKIPFTGELILRGEAVITYSDFEKINDSIREEAEKYKNPRNLCSGSVRQLNSAVTAERNVRFYAFSLGRAEGADLENSRMSEFSFLEGLGFQTVEHYSVTPDTIQERITFFAEKIKNYDIPSDGLVLTYEDVAYGESLGQTAKFPRHSIAFKWEDETAETTLREIEWSPSRTGLINPVAIFDAVELEGTSVSRASVHNISVMRELKLAIGDRIRVYKANMIIPQIAESITMGDHIDIPASCPACDGPTEVRAVNEAASLYCTNPDCPAKKIKLFTHFVGRDAMNIDGLSEATLEKFIGKGFLHKLTDLFHLDRFSAEIREMEGFGDKSCDNLLGSIETARKTTLYRLIYALGISGVGLSNAKLLCRSFGDNEEELIGADAEVLSAIDGIGPVIAGSIREYFDKTENMDLFRDLLKEVTLEKQEVPATDAKLQGMSFVVTGSLNHYKSRDELKEVIEGLGGKVTGSVTGKTVCLINNDVNSTSNKNQTARKLGVPVLSEDDFIAQYLA